MIVIIGNSTKPQLIFVIVSFFSSSRTEFLLSFATLYWLLLSLSCCVCKRVSKRAHSFLKETDRERASRSGSCSSTQKKCLTFSLPTLWWPQSSVIVVWNDDDNLTTMVRWVLTQEKIFLLYVCVPFHYNSFTQRRWERLTKIPHTHISLLYEFKEQWKCKEKNIKGWRKIGAKKPIFYTHHITSRPKVNHSFSSTTMNKYPYHHYRQPHLLFFVIAFDITHSSQSWSSSLLVITYWTLLSFHFSSGDSIRHSMAVLCKKATYLIAFFLSLYFSWRHSRNCFSLAWHAKDGYEEKKKTMALFRWVKRCGVGFFLKCTDQNNDSFTYL